MSEPYIAIQTVMMPSQANPYGTIFGGVILSHIDMAGSIAARREILRRGGAEAAFVTVALNRVEFKKPVLVGDIVRFVATVARIGRTSITMHVNVEAERGKDVIHVTESEVVYVGVDPKLLPADRRPIPLLPGNPT
jgi:acyl-CoA thioesterase YciA